MGKLLKGTPLNFVNPKQLVWVRTDAGDFSCIAETEINSSQVTVIVQDNGTAHAFCNSSPQVVYRRVDRHEGRPPIEPTVPTCKLLKLAYIYRLRNEEDKSQQLWLVNFDGTHHKIMDVPPAIFVHPDTYTIEVTNPGFHYKTFEIHQKISRQISTNTFFGESNWIEDPGSGADLEGYIPGVVTTLTYTYPPGEYVPPEVGSIYRAATLEESWQRGIRPYWTYASGYTSDLTESPSYTSFDGRSLLPNTWGSSITFEIPTADDPSGISTFTIGPWQRYSTAYEGSNQSNPTIQSFYTREDGSFTNEVTDYRTHYLQAAIEFVTSWDGPFMVTIPEGQARRPDIVNYQEAEAYLSFEGGELTVLVRLSGRAEGVPPEDEGDRLDLLLSGTWEWWDGQSRYRYFPDRRLFRLGSNGLEPKGAAPEWMQPLFEHFQTRYDIAGILHRLSEQTLKTELLEQIISQHNGGRDYWIAEDFHKVDSGVETTNAWVIDFERPEYFQEKLFYPEPSPPNPSLTPPTTYYSIFSLHYVEDAGYVLEDYSLPLREGINPERVVIKMGWDFLGLPDISVEDLYSGKVSVEALVGSWSRNSIYFCRDTKYVQTPEPDGS